MAHHLTELIGGLAVLLGAFIPLVSLPMAGLLFVAMLTVHLPYGFSSIKLLSVTSGRAQFGPPGYEVDLLYLACLAALVFGGSGPLAIDRYIGKKIASPHSAQDIASGRALARNGRNRIFVRIEPGR